MDPDMLQISIKERPIKNIEKFNVLLQDLLKDIKINNKVIALSIPNEVVKLSLIPLNTSLMDHEEAIQTIKWKLRETIPYEADNMQVSFQNISSSANGEESVITAVVNRDIVEQFEHIFLRKKLHAKLINVSSINHLNLYADYLKENGFTMLLTLFDDYFFFAAFDQNKLAYFRGKKTPPFTSEGSREISSTIDYYLSEIEKKGRLNKLGISIETKDMKNIENTLSKLYPFEICPLNPADVIPSLIDTKYEQEAGLYSSALGAAQMLYYKL